MTRHRLDWVSLVAGAIFLVVAVSHLLGAATDEHVSLGWLVPVGLLALGAAGLAGVLRTGRDTDRDVVGDTGEAARREPADPPAV